MSRLYGCPELGCYYAPLMEQGSSLCCPNGHVFHYIPGTDAPVFACEPDNVNDYTQEQAAQIHDNSFRWVFNTFNTDEASLRSNLVARLGLTKGDSVLITGAGAGNDLPFIAQYLQGAGVIYAQDISKQMLMAGIERYSGEMKEQGIEVYFSASDATNLPFKNDLFDAAYHFGGLNLFPDIKQGISEMVRVVRPGGRVLICDEGMAPWLKQTEFGKMLIKNNPLYIYDAPLSLLPDTVQSVKLSWELNHCFYVIDFTVSNTSPVVNIDIPHVGTRGGTIRSRYFGQLEGIDPVLRDQLYAEAEKQGMSRVDYLEQMLRKACAQT